MMDNKKFLQYYDLEVDINTHPTDEILKFLKDYVLGTEGSLRYRQLDIEERLSAVREIYFMTLKKYDRLLGTVGFVRRQLLYRGNALNTYYIRYFSIRTSSVRKKLRRDKNPKYVKKKKTKGSVIKKKVEEFMGQADGYLEGVGEKPTVLYAYIEKENSPSMQMSERMGYVTVRQMDLTYFSRLFPQSHPEVTVIKEKEKDQVLDRLRHFYRSYTLFTEESVFYRDGYFVYRDGQGDIVAGVQANRVSWKVQEMKGMSGWLFLKMVPHLFLMRKLYDGKLLRFVSFEAVFWEPGYERVLPSLFETALHTYELSIGILWHDMESPLRQVVRSLPRRGFLGKLISPKPAGVRMRFLNMSREITRLFYEHPVYVSAFDVT